MTMQTPATPAQPPEPEVPQAPGWYPDPKDPQFRRFWDGTGWVKRMRGSDVTREGLRQPKTPRELATYAWWLLVAWPVIFISGLIPVMALYPEGEGVSHGSVMDLLAMTFGVALICVPPLVAFALSAIAFRRDRTGWFLVLPVVLVLLLAGWGYGAWSQSGNWWGLVAVAVAASTLACVALWPGRKASTAAHTPDRA